MNNDNGIGNIPSPEELKRQMRLTCMANRTTTRAAESAGRQTKFIDKCLDAAADCDLDNDEIMKCVETVAKLVSERAYLQW